MSSLVSDSERRGENRIDFLMFKERPVANRKSEKALNNRPKVARDCRKNKRSSANAHIAPKSRGIRRHRYLISGSMARANSDPLVGHPCRIPEVIGKEQAEGPKTQTVRWFPVRRQLTMLRSHLGVPILRMGSFDPLLRNRRECSREIRRTE